MSEQAAFDALLDEFYPVWFRFHPDVAVNLGVPGFEQRLPAADDDDLSALGGWLENLVVALGELDFVALDPGRQLDYRLLLEAAQVEYQDLLLRDWRYLDPTRFLPVQEIFQITLHPPQELRGILIHLLQAVPGYLRHARTQLAEFPKVFAPQMVAVAMDEAEAGMRYLRALAESAWLRHHCSGCAEIQAASDEAVAAIGGYLETLRQEVAPKARGPLGCGESHFRRLLERRHFIDIPLESLRTYLEAAFRDTLRQLQVLAEQAGVAGEPGFVLAYLWQQADRRGEARLRAYRDESNRLREFVRARRLVTMPEQPFRIIQRPVCPRPGLCESGYMQEPNRHGGVFFISGREDPEDHPGEPDCFITSHCIRQGWLGAHLLAFADAGRARELPRDLAPREVFANAWRLYIRQFLLDAGYYDQNGRLLHVLEQLQSLGLALVDLDLNVGRIDAGRALDRITELQLDEHRALHALVGLGRNPTEALAGAVGWLLLHQAREQLQVGETRSPGEFHDQLLGEGTVPPAALLPHLFGPELWAAVREELLV